MTRRDPDQRGTQPGRLTPKKWAGTFGRARSPGMDESRRRRNREGRGEPPRLNRWRRRLAESMPSPGAAQAGPGCQAATVADGRRETETDAPRWRKITTWMQGGPKDGIRKPATGEWRAGGRTRDAKENSSQREYFTVPSNTHQIKPVYRKPCYKAILQLFGSSFFLHFTHSSKYPASKNKVPLRCTCN